MRPRLAVVAVCLLILSGAASAQYLDTLVMPKERLNEIQSALPDFVDPKLSRLLWSGETLWYDESTMQRSYQDSIGASSNDKWPDLVAASEAIIGGLHNRTHKRWQFPFSTTAGTDDSTNLRVANFVSFPQESDRVVSIPIQSVLMNHNRPEWIWTYPNGTIFGEVLFLVDGSSLLPVEVRTRTRYSTGWAMNAHRPFPRATDLIKRIQKLRPDWATTPNLKAMIDHLSNNNTLVSATLAGKGVLAKSFQQDGYLDILPSFGDDALVRKLLTSTPFRSSYGQNWKASGDKRTFAASTQSTLSIVPNNYKAGLIEVRDESCMRCHQETSRLVSEYIDDLYLYGQMWGMDGIFSFHPYDESQYPRLRFNMVDNRELNPKLSEAGIFKKNFSRAVAARHASELKLPAE